MKTRFTRSAFATLVLAVAAGSLLAGPLAPPVGPISSSHKTLTDVEPRTAISATNTPGDADSLYKITQPGSYYFTGNITGVAGKHGIEIAASGVTLDLNGFSLVGVPAMGNFDGVSVTLAGFDSIAVLNGSVRNWGGAGVDLGTFNASACRIERVIATNNEGHGIHAGSSTTFANCSAGGNADAGIVAGNGCTFSNCSAISNTGHGVVAGSDAAVSTCTTNLNGGSGMITNSGATIMNCSSGSNTGQGMHLGAGGSASNCSVVNNGGNGILGTIMVTISNCSAYVNGASGISVGGASSVIDCNVRASTVDGILCSTNCVIRGNTCSHNGNGGDGAGIHATDVDNRIEGNTCTSADRGIDVDFTGNIILKNICSGNTTNWSIAAGNAVAAIVSATTNAAAINGNTYTGSVGSTDPNANFTY